MSQVTDHNAIDLDQKSFERQLGEGTDESYVAAKAIYEEGGHSKSHAVITLTTPLTKDLASKDTITGTAVDGGAITASAYSSASTGEKVIKVKYTTSNDQDSHVGCQVGALPSDEHVTAGCFEAAGDLVIGGVTYPYTYTVESDNNNGRHIAGFSTSAESKMLKGCPGCPYKEFKKFYDYYGESNYAHQYVTAALTGTATNFANGDADFSKYGVDGRSQGAKKGSAYMNVYMYVIREFEDAIDDCQSNCVDCNYASAHAWDEGVAFYTGSLEGETGDSDGKLLHALADKRCQNFKTCGVEGDELEGRSKINRELAQQFTVGQFELLTSNCDSVRPIVDKISDLMSVPLIQGTLRYAYKVDKLKGVETQKAEGAVFMASVIPRVHACDAEDAKIIYDNMRIGATSTDFAAVKKAFENQYECMGVNGALVGGLWNDSTSDYYEGAEPKKDSSTGGGNGLAIGLGVGAACIAVIAIGGVFFMMRRERQGKPVFKASEHWNDNNNV